MVQDKRMLEPGADTVEALEREGLSSVVPFTAPDDPMTAGDLMSLLISGIKQGLIDPDKPLKLEDPNLMHPWDIRGAQVEGDELILDVWGH